MLDWALLSGPVPVALRLLVIVPVGWQVLWPIARRGRAAPVELGGCLLAAPDVSARIKTHLTVDADPQSWAVGGISYAGTLALQLATNHPVIYTTFVDISGSAEPTLGDQRRTIAEVFGRDPDACRRVNPLDLLRRHPYRRNAGAIVVGAAERDTRPDTRLVYAATTAAGMDTHYTEVPVSHDWHAFAGGLTRELPWLAARIGLTGTRA